MRLAVPNFHGWVGMHAEIVLPWWWDVTRWLKEIVKIALDLNSPLPQICQNGIILTEFITHLAFPDVDRKNPITTEL